MTPPKVPDPSGLILGLAAVRTADSCHTCGQVLFTPVSCLVETPAQGSGLLTLHTTQRQLLDANLHPHLQKGKLLEDKGTGAFGSAFTAMGDLTDEGGREG